MKVLRLDKGEIDTAIVDTEALPDLSEFWDRKESPRPAGPENVSFYFDMPSDLDQSSDQELGQPSNTETIDVNPLFAKELDISGTFDLSGIVETSLGKFLNALPTPVLVLDQGGLVIFANDAYEAPNSDEDSIVGRSILRLFSNSAHATTVETMIQAVLTKRKQQVASISLTRRRQKLWGRMCMRPIRIANEQFILVVIEDRTLEMRQILLNKRNEEELEMRVKQRTTELLTANALMKQEISVRKRVEAKLRLAGKIIESSTDAIFITTVNGKITDVNGSFSRISGYNKDEVVGLDLSFLASDRQNLDFYKNVWQTVTEQGVWRGEVWDRRKNGEEYAKMLSVSAVRRLGGEVSHYVGIFSDITKMKHDEERLQKMAHFDALTGLPNRVLLYDRINQAILAAKRYNQVIAIMLMDLDRFKNINDTLGHGFGDQLLIAVSKRLTAGMRQSDTASRLGGDEFAVCLPRIRSSLDAATFARKVIDRFSVPIHLDGKAIVVSASMGIALYPNDGEEVDRLLQNADTAMYHAKENGKNNFHFFSKEMNARVQNRLELENTLRQALSQRKFLLHYQPIVDLSSMRVTGMEALLRLFLPSGEAVSPCDFIPVAEETGLIVPIGEWALRTACRQNKRWQDMGLPPLKVSVNVSGNQMRQGNFVATVMGILEETQLDPRCLELELTESIMMEDFDKVIKIFEQFNSHGVHVSMDDFGTGYSSLSYLRRFPISTLKIDRSFIKDIAHPYEQELVKSILAVAHSRDLIVIAEGVETPEQLEFLQNHGCDGAQGYFFSPPVPAEEITRLLQNGGHGQVELWETRLAC